MVCSSPKLSVTIKNKTYILCSPTLLNLILSQIGNNAFHIHTPFLNTPLLYWTINEDNKCPVSVFTGASSEDRLVLTWDFMDWTLLLWGLNSNTCSNKKGGWFSHVRAILNFVSYEELDSPDVSLHTPHPFLSPSLPCPDPSLTLSSLWVRSTRLFWRSCFRGSHA